VSRRVSAMVLTLLTVLFSARVGGQVLVAFAGVPWLPPMEAWYSGLLPYPILLPVQLLILAVQATIDWQVWRGAAFFARPRPRLGRSLRGLSYVYALAMLVRLVLTRTHAIPIVFHWVLAAYLFTLGGYYARAGTPAQGSSIGTNALPTPKLPCRARPGPIRRPFSGGRTPRAADR
jgi:hypothetical protein